MPLEDQAESQSDDFDAGFNDVAAAPTEKPVQEAAVAEPAPEAPKLAQITEEQFQHLLARATAIDEIKAAQEKQFGTAFGKIGGIERLINQLQAAAPAGQPIELTEDDFDELRADFPDLAAMQVKGFNKALARANARVGSPVTTPGIDPEILEQRIQERLAPEIQKVRDEAMAKITDLSMRQFHPDWKQVATQPEFAAWQKTLPAAEQEALASSNDPEFVSSHISKFKASLKTAASQAKRFEQAVTPRGTGGHAPGPDEDDEFSAGFNGK
jgi:hypothetical protein